MKKVNFEEYKNSVLNIYEETNKVFSNLGIELWAHSGSLLGIIRHNEDFIPWDDDIDLMVSYKEYIENKEKITKEINSSDSGIYIVDNKNDCEELGFYSNIWMIKVFSKDKLNVVINGEENVSRPFIDIFFATPSDTFNNKGWKKYSRNCSRMWMFEKGFDRYHRYMNKKINKFFVNLFTYPFKIFISSEKFKEKLEIPFKNINGDWSKLRRADKWSYRNIEYDLEVGFIEKELRKSKILIYKNYEYELISTFGKDWHKEKKLESHLSSNLTKYHKKNISMEKMLVNKIS